MILRYLCEMVNFLFLPEVFGAFGEAFVGVGAGWVVVVAPAGVFGDVACFVGFGEGAEGVGGVGADVVEGFGFVGAVGAGRGGLVVR